MASFYKWMIIITIAFGAYQFRSKSHQPTRIGPLPTNLASTERLQPAVQGATDPCLGHEKCVTVYVAPWCSACKAMLPQLIQLRDGPWKNSNSRALKFIVGEGDLSSSRALASQIGPGAMTDPDHEFAHAMQVNHFPTVWLTEASGRIISMDQDVFAWVNEDLKMDKK